ncbi:MAG: YggT family protein [Candidatus Neomarinimicrobiota bacterium]
MDYTLYRFINLLFQFLYLCLIARVILSWVPHNAYNPVVQFLYKITNPILKPIQEILPPMRIGIDISPILALVALGFIKKIIVWAMF